MTTPVSDACPRTVRIGLFAALLMAACLRGSSPPPIPPGDPPVGIVWHDEGAWVHNARNKALFGAWTLDAWNPVYIAPVFTGLEYAAFKVLGVGVRQARLVSELTGFLSVLLLAWGVSRVAGRTRGDLCRRTARHQLCLRDVRQGRDDGGFDGRLHGGESGTSTCAPGSVPRGGGRPRHAPCSPSSPRHPPHSSSRRWRAKLRSHGST